MTSFTPYRGILQLAYVTTDFDRALEDFREQYGVPYWLELRELEIQTGEGRSCQAHVALAFVGATQLEIIQPLGGDDTVFRHGLPEQGYGLCFHHFAQLIDTEEEFEALEKSVQSGEIPVAISGASFGMARYFYTDCRKTLGHFVEHVCYSPEGLSFMEQIRAYSEGGEEAVEAWLATQSD